MPIQDFITARGASLRVGDRPLVLRGYNLGNWLLLEDFMLGLHGTDTQMREAFQAVLGARAARFWEAYEDAYFTAADAARLRAMGANVLRVPLNQHRFEDPNRPGEYRADALARLDRVVKLCSEHELWVVLDLHAVFGGQSREIYADSPGALPDFWRYADLRRRATGLWVELARRYADEPAVAGYDLLNEPLTEGRPELLVEWYRETIAAIRRVDTRHLIWLETDDWGGRVDGLPPELLEPDDVTLQFHRYPIFWLPSDRLTDYPQELDGVRHDREWMRASWEKELGFGRRKPLFFGETGLNLARPQAPMMRRALEDMVAIAGEERWSLALWSYKDVGAMGLLSPREDTPWKRFLAEPESVAARALTEPFFPLKAQVGGPAVGLQDGLRRIAEPFDRRPYEPSYVAAKCARRPFDGLLSRRILHRLAARSDAEIEALARSFAHEQCAVHPLLDGLLGIHAREARRA
jgi:hypothetical protein